MADRITFEGVQERRHFAELMKQAQGRLGRPFGGFAWGFALAAVVFFVATLALLRLAHTHLVPRVPGQFLDQGMITLIALLAGVVLGVGTYVAVMLGGQRRIVARMLRDGGSYLGPRGYVLDAEGVHISGPHGTSFSPWSLFTDVGETDSALFLWSDPAAAVILPKSALSGAGDIDSVKAFAEQKIAVALRSA